MAIGIAKGTWNWLPFGLGSVDLGLTEKYAPSLGKNPAYAQPIGQESIPYGTQTKYGTATKTTNYNTGGNVLGTQTGPGGAYPIAEPRPTGTIQQTPTGGSGGSGDGGGEPSGPSPEELYMQFLNQQYDAGNNAINEMESGLGGQKSSMEQVAQNTYQQGANSLNTAYGTNKGDLESYQAKSLQDIGDNLRAMWGQGSRVLGSRGAADSSAAGQYNYAISKLGSKQRGDVMQDVSRRLGNLKSTYDTNLQNLELEKNNQVQQIAQWYAEAQNQIRGMRAELQQQKSEQALNMAMNMLNEAKTQAANRQSILDSWAVNKAQSLPELQGMLAQNAQGLQPVGSLGAGLNFGGATQKVNKFGFGNQEQDSLNWLQSLMPR